MTRPHPAKVTSHLALPIPPPSDAIVLFDGKDLSNWQSVDGGPAGWVVKNGAMESVRGAGYVYTKQGFGDVQLHVEWAAPTPGRGEGQGRGNSGVFLMGKYEVQVLDSYENITYADGQASAIYGQYPPLANVSRPAGEWQCYDIIFRRPRFKPDGSLVAPARLTVLHNGVLVQDNVEAWGPTSWLQHYPYKSHPDRLPLALQDHGNPVLFRNIWVRELRETPEPGPTNPDERSPITLTSDALDRYVGEYAVGGENRAFGVSRNGDTLYARFVAALPPIELVPFSKEEFGLRWTAAKVVFDLDAKASPTALTFFIGGEELHAKKK